MEEPKKGIFKSRVTPEDGPEAYNAAVQASTDRFREALASMPAGSSLVDVALRALSTPAESYDPATDAMLTDALLTVEELKS